MQIKFRTYRHRSRIILPAVLVFLLLGLGIGAALALLFAPWPWMMAPIIAAVVTGSWIWTRPEA